MKKIDENSDIVLNTSWDCLPFHIDGVLFNLVRLQPYQRSLKQCRKLEPRLEEEIEHSLRQDVLKNQFTEIPGTGGWIKGRVASPSRGIGKSGGFRVIYLFLKVAQYIFLARVYDHRAVSDITPDDKNDLKLRALELRRALKEMEDSDEN